MNERVKPTEERWLSTSVPIKDMPAICEELLAGGSRNAIGRRYGVSGQWISQCVITWLRMRGEPVVPGITRRARSQRRSEGRRWFKDVVRQQKKNTAWTAASREASPYTNKPSESPMTRERPQDRRIDRSCTRSDVARIGADAERSGGRSLWRRSSAGFSAMPVPGEIRLSSALSEEQNGALGRSPRSTAIQTTMRR